MSDLRQELLNKRSEEEKREKRLSVKASWQLYVMTCSGLFLTCVELFSQIHPPKLMDDFIFNEQLTFADF
jgi:hypothetical protein